MSAKKEVGSRTDTGYSTASGGKDYAMEVTIELKQIKQSGRHCVTPDRTVQMAEAITVVNDEKMSIQIPFSKPLVYRYKKLTEECIYKFAVMQDDNLLGALYIEIPHQYKSQKKFKIEDWQPLKHLDAGLKKNSEPPYLVWVVLHYSASSVLDLTGGKTESLQGTTGVPRVSEKLKDINKDIREHEKEGFNYLDDVERKIRDRRRRNVAQAAADKSPEKPNAKNPGVSLLDSPSKMLQHPLSNNKKHDLGTNHKKSKSPRKLPVGKAVTPDDLYSQAMSKLAKTDGGGNNSDKNFSQELTAATQEIVKLRAKVKALEDGQMTVDNLELSRMLEKEQAEMNRQRSKLLKEYAEKNDRLESELEKAKLTNKDREQQFLEQKQVLENERQTQMEREADLIDREASVKQREDNIDLKFDKLSKEEREIQAAKQKVDSDRLELADYAAELDELKERLVAERNKLVEGKGKADMTRAELERDSKDIELARHTLEAENKALEREKKKLQEQIANQQEALKSQQQNLQDSQEELDRLRKVLEDKSKQTGQTQGTLEEERIEVWKERNKLANEIKEFLEDKRVMEKDLRNKQREVEEAQEQLREMKEEADEELAESKQRLDTLEAKEKELETRERKLLHEREEFSRFKRKFIEGVLQSGSYEKMTPEMRKMAKDLGVDIDELIEEDKRIQERKNQLEALKKLNDEQM